MKKLILILSLSFSILSFSQTANNLNSLTTTKFSFELRDQDFNKSKLRWSFNGSGSGSERVFDFVTIANTGGSAITADRSMRISNGRGFEFGNGNFSQEFMRLDPQGNLGVGISNPTEKLHIAGGLNNFIRIDASARTSSDISTSGIKIGNSAQISVSTFSGLGSGDLNFSTNFSDINFFTRKMNIISSDQRGSGNLNIEGLTWTNNLMVADFDGGDLPEGFKMAVDGRILCEGMLVKTSEDWPDYVFQSDYQLKSLSQVTNYIEENGHLPGVPSAEEIETEGLDVSAIQTIQMEKIEELTLYLIELDKQNKQLQQELSEVKELLK